MNFNFLFSHTEVSDSNILLNQKKAIHNQTKIIINSKQRNVHREKPKGIIQNTHTPDSEGVIQTMKDNA